MRKKIEQSALIELGIAISVVTSALYAVNATPAIKNTIHPMQLNAQKISTHETAPPTKLQMSLGSNQVQFNSTLSLADEALLGRLNLSDIVLSNYQPYLNLFLAANVSGELSLKTQVALQPDNIRLNQLPHNGALHNFLNCILFFDHQPCTNDSTLLFI